MRFNYHRAIVRDPVTDGFSPIYRPKIEVIVAGPLGTYNADGRVDTGADDILLPDFLIGVLGVAIGPQAHAAVGGIGGMQTLVRYGTVNLELRKGKRSLRWSARVGFHAAREVVFGLCAFLEHFTATFNGQGRILTLQPNGTAPPPVVFGP